jgi:hypothetical protein
MRAIAATAHLTLCGLADLLGVMRQTNLDKLVAANLLDLSEIGPEEQNLLNSLSEEEIDALVQGGTRVSSRTDKTGPVRVGF